MNSKELISKLEAEKINTWFDLGLFLDHLKENPINKPTRLFKSFNDYKNHLSNGGIAFVSFFYSVDGASTECLKYVNTLKNIINGFSVHYIAGKFYDTGNQFLYPDAKLLQFDELKPFDEWDLYKDFFYKKLERGSRTYNRLIKAFWKETLVIAKKLSDYIEKNDIRLLYLININSNPGNVSQALATVLVSEYMDIPVINNCHDFYWEEGHSEIDIEENNFKPGPRDHFFKNFHLGEVFSLIEMIYPWDSRKWLSLSINRAQCDELIAQHGQNPANVQLIDTCVDIEKYKTVLSAERRVEVLQQINFIFQKDKKNLQTYSVGSFPRFKDTSELFPVLFSDQQQKLTDFEKDNIVLLQPTRILKRKAIEVDFRLITKLFNDYEVLDYFDENENLSITILITGPVAIGNINYFYSLLNEFQRALKSIDVKYRSKIFLGFMFSAFDKKDFKARFKNPFDLNELYKTATMILLPSTTEGRGLPIIEAAACGVPVFCRRYNPEHVFAHVIGEHLPKVHRINVISFRDPNLNEEIIESVKQHIFAPKAFESSNKRNKEMVKNRYSFERLKQNLNDILYKLYLQINSGEEEILHARKSLIEYEEHLQFNKSYAKNLLNTQNRQYLAGFGQMNFMLMLKSLIDPSYFRVEEKRIRGFAMQFAKDIIKNTPDPSPLPVEEVHHFFNAVDRLFKYKDGEMKIRVDHSMSYRHRNINLYPYRKYTPQELTGVINILYHNFTSPPPVIKQKPSEISEDWHQNMANLYANSTLEIDHIDDLENKLLKNIPIALFPGKYIELEFETFILAPARKRLRLAEKEKIDDTNIHRKKLAPMYIISNRDALGNLLTADILKSFIFYNSGREMHTLFKHGVCKIIESEQKSVGLHFYEIGKKASDALEKIKSKKGILITTGDHAAMMTDIVSLDRFHIGTVSNMFTAKIMGIPFGSSYVQWVPPGLRFALAYPTPIQTGKSFSQSLKGFRFKRLSEKMGQNNILKKLQDDARKNSNPINTVLRTLEKETVKKESVNFTALNGVYKDGMPWSGTMAHVVTGHAGKKWNYSVLTSGERPKTVVQFVEDFNLQKNGLARVAWNGGYILNPELVGKLGIPEIFIGTPLGLIISDGKVQSPPLFNKAALLIDKSGAIQVQKVNSSNGLTINDSGKKIIFSEKGYNLEKPDIEQDICYYDLLYPDREIYAAGRVIVRLAGNKIKDIIETKTNKNIPVLPVGLALSFPKNQRPQWKVDQELDISVHGLENYVSAIEAGPHLLQDGKMSIDMQEEGWKTQNSIKTQAARLDYTDMRGPKIAVGINEKGDLFILTINGRIRESVGATHFDMAEIFKKQGIIHALGFDPGGSSTLVVDGKTLNISPYNREYERDVYSLPPEPRAVANAFVIWENK